MTDFSTINSVAEYSFKILHIPGDWKHVSYSSIYTVQNPWSIGAERKNKIILTQIIIYVFKALQDNQSDSVQ